MGANHGPEGEPLIARDATYYRAPQALRARVHGTLAAQARAQLRPVLWRWGATAAAFAATIALTWNVALLQARGGETDRIAREVESAHVRSLMVEGHLNDVASSDRHTVKPWFEGRIDFAPRVENLAPAGFALIGGRLDYIDGRAVAALTYRHRLHVVNLFEWPTAEPGDTEPSAISRRGYAVAHWRAGGLEYWAVADIGRDDLLQFARALEPR